MQKSKLGISVGLLGALACFSALFGEYLATIVVVGYVLLVEENQWLKRTCVKAALLLVLFNLAGLFISFIPSLVGFINDIILIFSDEPILGVVTRIVAPLRDILYFAEKVVFIIFGVKALGQKPLYIPVVDNLISKYMN